MTPLLRIFTYLYQILSSDGNDRGLSLLTSFYYKPLFDRSPHPTAFLQHAKSEIFGVLLNALDDGRPYILEQTERLQAGLNLYVYLRLRERVLIKNGAVDEPVVGEETWVRETVRKGWLDPLAHAIEAGHGSVEEEEAKVAGQAKEVREHMHG